MTSCSPICCSKSELDLTLSRLKQVAVIDGHWVKYNPIASVTRSGSTAEYFVQGGRQYIDLSNTLVYWKLKIVKADGTVLVAGDDVAFANFIHGTVCKQVNVYLNGKMVSSACPTYDQRAYFTVLGSFGYEAKTSQLQAMGWEPDKYGHMEAGANNTGYQKRKAWTAGSTPYDVIGPLFIDIFQQPKYLLNNVDLRIQFVLNPPAKCLMVPDANNDTYDYVIEDACIYVRKADVSPQIMMEHAALLTKGVSLGYNINRTEVKSFTVPAGTSSYTVEDLGLGRLPQEALIGFILGDAYTGSFKKNAYNLQHFKINHLALNCDGHPVPADPFKPNFLDDGGGCYAREYLSLFNATGKLMSDEGNNISRKAFSQGYTLFAVNLRPDLSDGGLEQPKQTGNLRLEVIFGANLAHVINIVCLLVYDNNIIIDRNRNVLLDYTP